jgi:cell division protein FtsQ
MRSKSKKNKRKKSAYRRGEKLVIFFRRGTLVLVVIALFSAAVLGVKWLSRKFYVSEVVVSGNYYLDEEDIVTDLKLRTGEPLLTLDLETMNEKLTQNAWIKNVSLRKQFPRTLMIAIEESVPKALLSMKKRFYLLDSDGEILERLEGESTPFLPVIKGINPRNKKGMSEAIKLIDVISRKNSLANRESIVIGMESYGLTMKIDGEMIKVGYGAYSEKFDRWVELEPEIRKRGVPIKYVDLRFKDSVIVKPEKRKRG